MATETPIADLLAEIKRNRKRLDRCERHVFDRNEHGNPLGRRFTCTVCEGHMSLTEIGNYISGYEAKGGSCEDIMAGYRKAKQ